MSLTREEILAKNAPQMEEAEVWGGTVWVRTIVVADALKLLEQESDAHRGLLLLEQAVVDEDGNRLFQDGDVQQLQFTEDLQNLLAKAVEVNPMFQTTGDDDEGN